MMRSIQSQTIRQNQRISLDNMPTTIIKGEKYYHNSKLSVNNINNNLNHLTAIYNPTNKRSIQSLIQQSAIDPPSNSATLNLQIIQLKKTYNQAYKSMSQKIQKLQKQIYDKNSQLNRIKQQNQQLKNRFQVYSQHKEEEQEYIRKIQIINEKLKRKLMYIGGKYKQMLDNRSHVDKGYEQQEQELTYQKWVNENNLVNLKEENKIGSNNDNKITNTLYNNLTQTINLTPKNQFLNVKQKQKQRQKHRQQIYKQISQILNKKIKQFIFQLKQFYMNKQTQIKIQTFLQQLMYLNPITTITLMMQGTKGVKGKILRNKERQIQSEGMIVKGEIQNISDQQAWKQLDKSVEKKNKKYDILKDISYTPTKQNVLNKQYAGGGGSSNKVINNNLIMNSNNIKHKNQYQLNKQQYTANKRMKRNDSESSSSKFHYKYHQDYNNNTYNNTNNNKNNIHQNNINHNNNSYSKPKIFTNNF